MLEQLPPVLAEKNGNHIVITDHFGNTNVNGLQHKGAIQINNESYFAKLDDLNPTVNGQWENRYDVQFSSLSEAISSILVKNIESKQDFDSVEYEFATFNINGKQSSGTISKNYLKDNELERVLAIGRTVDPHTLITTDEYAENIMDVSNQDRFDHFIKYFTDHNVPYEHAKSFLIQQAAFDIMTGNNDRLGNPSNFIIAYNDTTQTGRLINFDYGRTLPLLWTEMTETNYNISWLEEDIESNAKNINAGNDSIISSLTKNQAIEFLTQNGFKPFELNMDNLKKDLATLNQTIQNSDVPFKKFAEVKIQSFEKSFEQPFMKQFYVEKSTSPSIDFSHNYNPVDTSIETTPRPTINYDKQLKDKADTALSQITSTEKDKELERQ